MNFIFIGPPGSGKGTQATRLSKELGLVHLSSGDILREAVRTGSEIGEQARQYMETGSLVPDELIIKMIRDIINKHDHENGFILDGFPRTIPQAESLKNMLEEIDTKIDHVVHLKVADEEIIKRLSGRWHCPTCNTGYNYPQHLPKIDGICDNDGSRLERRQDDEEKVVRHRLAVYKEETEPIVNFFERSSSLSEINGHDEPDRVFANIMRLAS